MLRLWPVCCTGISKEEAIEMYNKCNADGGDGVSIEEFEKWCAVNVPLAAM